MTSDVMAGVPARRQAPSMSLRILVLAVFVPFLLFSLWCGATHGPLGFLTLAGREPWGLQVLLDLAVSLCFVVAWMIADARRRGATVWPFVVATILLGSVGSLSYLLSRGPKR